MILTSMTGLAVTIRDEDGTIADFAWVLLQDLEDFKSEYLQPTQTIQFTAASEALH